MSEHLKPTDFEGHILDNVDIHLVVTNGQALVSFHGITLTYFKDGLPPLEHTGKLLSGVILPVPGVPDMDDWHSLRHLDEAFEEWDIPTTLQNEVRIKAELVRQSLRCHTRPDPANVAAQREVEALMRKHNLRGLVWGEADLAARLDERLDECDSRAEYTLPDGVTRSDVVAKAQTMPAWSEESWGDGHSIPWCNMADAVEEALIALCGPARR